MVSRSGFIRNIVCFITEHYFNNGKRKLKLAYRIILASVIFHNQPCNTGHNGACFISFAFTLAFWPTNL